MQRFLKAVNCKNDNILMKKIDAVLSSTHMFWSKRGVQGALHTRTCQHDDLLSSDTT